MEEELSKTKIIFVAAVGIVFVVMIGLFIVTITKQKVQLNSTGNEMQDVSSEAKSENLDSIKIDEIEFEDPGDDEVGKEIKELDELINNTRPSELSGDDLSDDLVSGELELE
ncbi:MAG: hypothetical protein U9O20_00650 [Patescibacteria group bacterium]|nr:hypothetical protein [Patescibacteria group bacterium]